jgi:hypothetical protein
MLKRKSNRLSDGAPWPFVTAQLPVYAPQPSTAPGPYLCRSAPKLWAAGGALKIFLHSTPTRAQPPPRWPPGADGNRRSRSCWLASTSSVMPYLVRSAVSFGASRQSCPSASLAGMSEAGHQAARVACHHRDGLRYSLMSESLPGSNDPKHPNRPSFCRSTCAESAQSRPG